MNNLKEKILEFTRNNHTDYSKLERQAGLTKNFISNIIYGKSKNPGIDSIIKLADALNISIDELVGKTEKNDISPDVLIENKKIFIEIVSYVLNAIKRKESIFKSTEVFKAIISIYNYCSNKNQIDKKFANWYLDTYF